MNRAPADKKKEGPIYDLPLLISLLKASHQLECHTDDAVFLGELSLSGELRPIRGVLPMADKAKEAGFQRLYVPAENAGEGAVIQGLQVYPCLLYTSPAFCVLDIGRAKEQGKTTSRRGHSPL